MNIFCSMQSHLHFKRIQLTPGNPNPPATQSECFFPSSHFLYNSTIDNSNSRQHKLFLIPLKVRVIGATYFSLIILNDFNSV